MTSHYVFEPEFCNPASGWEKGRVAKNVRNARRHAKACRRCCRSIWNSSMPCARLYPVREGAAQVARVRECRITVCTGGVLAGAPRLPWPRPISPPHGQKEPRPHPSPSCWRSRTWGSAPRARARARGRGGRPVSPCKGPRTSSRTRFAPCGQAEKQTETRSTRAVAIHRRHRQNTRKKRDREAHGLRLRPWSW
jgi:hypothetical protein